MPYFLVLGFEPYGSRSLIAGTTEVRDKRGRWVAASFPAIIDVCPCALPNGANMRYNRSGRSDRPLV